MKKLVLMLILVSIGFVYAQEDFYVMENDEHANNTTGDELIFNEPIAVGSIIAATTTTSEETPDLTPEQDMSASVEATYSEFTKKLNIPLWYRWKDFSFSAQVPYILSKGNNINDETVSGLGDISVGFGYGKYLPEQNLYLDLNFTAKLPTGEEDVEADDGTLFDLGTKTLDMTGAISAFYFKDDFTFKGNLVYTMNGKFDNDLWDPAVEVDRGDDFLFSAGADYRWQYRLTFGLGVLYGNHFASETDGNDDKNSMSYMDVIPVVKYPISLLEFVVGAKIPVMTSAEAHDPDDAWSNQENRNATIFFRTNYQLF